MIIQDKEELIDSIRCKRDSLNDLLESLKETKDEWYDSGTSNEDMKSIRKNIRKVIYQRDKCDNMLDELGKLRLVTRRVR